jgi:hypothetical protein
MKNYQWLAVLVAGLGWNASATLFTYNWNVGAPIPDGDPSGYVNNQTISDGLQGNDLPANPLINSPSGISVHLNLSGGWNGDLYGYLRYDDGSGGVGFTVLLNRVGQTEGNPIGYTTAGMNVWLTDSASYTDIHTVETPGFSGATYRVDQTGSSTSFVSFQGLDPTAGTWSLLLADLSGSHVSTLEGWGLTLDVVPEPITWALVIFGGVLGVAKAGQYCWRRRSLKPAEGK